MKEKENVYLENTPTGTGEKPLSSTESESAVKDVSAVLGKFKDVDALARAYSALQAEFTRRSQRLKELEREIQMREEEKRGMTEDSGRALSTAEKLRRNAAMVRKEGRKFSSFVAELEQVGAQLGGETLPDDSQSTAENAVRDRDAEDAEEAVPLEFSSVAGQEVAALSADSLFEQVNRNENVRLKIIGEYLSSLKKSGAPLMTGGAGTLAAPPVKPKTVKEAGNMALRFFKNGTQA